MKREDQIRLIETVEDRLNRLADRVMSDPVVRRSVTEPSDERHATAQYESETLHVRYG